MFQVRDELERGGALSAECEGHVLSHYFTRRIVSAPKINIRVASPKIPIVGLFYPAREQEESAAWRVG